MKTFSGTFNGQKYMGVEHNPIIQEIGISINKCKEAIDKLWGPDKSLKILGTYQTKGEIDFDAKMDWVEIEFDYEDDQNISYKNYTGGLPFLLHKLSLLSLFDRDSRMAFPLEENPYPKPPKTWNPYETGVDEGIEQHKQWSEAESQVRPKSFLIILVK